MKERPIENTLPSEIKAKAREYAKTIEHSYADTREELEEDVAKAWAKGFLFCLHSKVTAIYKNKEETIQKLTDENKKLQKDVEYYTQKLERVLTDLGKMKCCENCKYNSYWGNELHCNYGLKEAWQEDKLVECKNMDKWEIKEND